MLSLDRCAEVVREVRALQAQGDIAARVLLVLDAAGTARIRAYSQDDSVPGPEWLGTHKTWRINALSAEYLHEFLTGDAVQSLIQQVTQNAGPSASHELAELCADHYLKNHEYWETHEALEDD